ncbi:LysM peptidoglycan-binding domain-containing protein [Aeromicrobium sp. CTD01-1L150]|uniref:LysM peptidoglycan-binding domain-containing protein n=1 Tax=Aeromicrobium sp. CTD01-1L150 TaxID=3341830 RepID=UPI0035C11D8F
MSTISLTPHSGFAHHGDGTAAHLRLTRRGRVVVLLAALALIALAAVALGPSVVASGDRGDAPAATVVTVQPGQTLWQIAVEANPSGDPREAVEDIMRMNSLSSAGELQMGRELAVPVYE